jgi:hypothetical protein
VRAKKNDNKISAYGLCICPTSCRLESLSILDWLTALLPLCIVPCNLKALGWEIKVRRDLSVGESSCNDGVVKTGIETGQKVLLACGTAKLAVGVAWCING